MPFKPAQSGDEHPSDAERLLLAAGLPLTELDAVCPLRFALPLAPGLAEDPSPFLAGSSLASRCPELEMPSSRHGSPLAPLASPPPAVIARSALALAAWEARHHPDLTLVEGAGGLHVPMPGGTWQPAWITALAPWTLVVGRAGLGTIHHCLSTIAGLRAVGRPPLGFVLSQTTPAADPSTLCNAAVIANASGLPHLGTLRHAPEPALVPALLDALLARLAH